MDPDAFDERAITGERPYRRNRRKHTHPLEITSDRLGSHYERYYEFLTGQERDALSELREAFYQIVNGERAK